MYRTVRLDEVVLEDDDFAPRRAAVKAYLQAFDLDRLLHTFRRQAGLPSDAMPLGGWEEEACGLRGHFTGHFLSACARYAFADDDAAMRARVGRIVDVLATCARADGYLSAFEETVLDTLEAEENRNVWAPYYTLHKILQGLVDAYRFTDNGQALEVAVNLAHYIRGRFRKLSFWKIDGILRCTKVNPVNEFGGIGDALYSLHELTGDKELLAFAMTFDRPYFLDNLTAGRDVLENLHANTHLPMILAAMHRYDLTGEPGIRQAVMHFLSFLEGRTFANGSNSSKATAFIPGQVSERSEHWGAYGDLHDALTGGECESCCAHNTERMLEHAFAWTGDVRWLVWLEGLRYNAVLNSASISTGLSQYHQPLGEHVRKTFSRPYDDFWCCTGSGIEAMSELQKNIWLRAGDTLLMNLAVSSTLTWKEKGIRIEQRSGFPDRAETVLTIRTERPVSFTLQWKAVSVRGVSMDGVPAALVEGNGFISLTRDFQDGDVLVVSLAAERVEVPLPGDGERRAVRVGPVLMAEVVTEPEDAMPGAPSAAGDATGGNGGPISGLAGLVPLFRVTSQPYTVYRKTAGACAGCETAGRKPDDKAADGRAAYGC